MNNLETQNLINKLLYRSVHRGCKETDFLLGKYGEIFLEKMDLEKLKLFEEFLDEDDMMIYDWILEKVSAPQKYDDLLLEIREFHKI
jgi:antitoxin CptB